MRSLQPNAAFVPPKIGNGHRLVVIAAPGEEDALKGEPLSGGAGRWFDNMARKAGLRRDDLSMVGCINCRPPDDVFPTDPDAKSYISPEDGKKAVAQCLKNHTMPFVKGMTWNRIDLLGDYPLTYIAERSGGVFKWRGSPIEIPALDNKLCAIATLEPQYIVKDQALLPIVINDLAKSTTPPPEYYNPYPSLEDVKNFKFTDFAFDIETNRWTQEISMVGLCAKPYFAIVVPFRGAYIDELKRIFRSATSVVGHNCVQFDLPILRNNGVTITRECQIWDTMFLQHLCFPDFPHDLEFVGSQFCNKPAWKGDKQSLEVYCARDVDVTMQCFKQLKPMVQGHGMEDLYKYVSVPIGKICRLMNETGFKVDVGNIDKIRDELTKKMAQAELDLPKEMQTQMVPAKRRIPAPPGTLSEKTKKPIKFIHEPYEKEVVPWRSSAKKQAFLYGTTEPWHLGLPVQYDVKTNNVTTGKNALEKLYRKTKNKALMALKNLNKWDELITTFCKEGMTKIDRMHPHFNVHGTASGRLSSSDPNLQNIPESARYIYVPSHEGWKIIDVDYSGIENRLTAYIAGDTARLERFVTDPGFSEHKYAAALFTGVSYDEVEKSSEADSPYKKAKGIVHGTNFGEGAKKISLLNDWDYKETKQLHDKWKAEIAPTIRWQNQCAEQARKDGYLRTVFRRMRWFYTSSYYTEALSFLPQSTAADIIFRAMIGLMYERIDWPIERVNKVVRVAEALPKPARLLLQVHDSLIFECPANMVDECLRVIQKVMEQPWAELGGMSIPIGIKVGDSWGEAEDYKPLD